MSKRKNLNNVDLSFHLQHPGRGSEPGDPNAIFYLNGVYHLHYILRHKWNGVRKNLPRRNFPFNHSHSFCLLYTSPSPRDGLLSRMPSSA